MGKNLAEINLKAMRDERDDYKNKAKQLETDLAIIKDERDELKQLLQSEREAHNALIDQAGTLCFNIGVNSGKTTLDMLKTATEEVERIGANRDEWQNVVMSIRDELGIERDGCSLAVEAVRKLKEAQRQAVPEQVLALQETIRVRDEQWNAICVALGLLDKGRTPESEVVNQALWLVKEFNLMRDQLEEANKHKDVRFVRKVCAIFDLHGPSSRQAAVDNIHALKSKVVDLDRHSTELEKALNQSLTQQTKALEELQTRLEESESEYREEIAYRVEAEAKAETWRDAYELLLGARA